MQQANREQWLAERRKGIGGSDAAAVLGLSKWKTPFQVWQDKLGQIPPIDDNNSMRWGRALEPVIRQQYAEETGREVLVPTAILQHPTHQFMLANLDGFTHDKRVVEIKTARYADGWGESGTDQIPQDYLIQVQHYMAVTGFAVADVAVLIGGSDFRLYEVPADAELQAMIIDGEALFWEHVQNNVPPEILNFSDAVARYGKASTAGSVEASDELAANVTRLAGIKSAIDELEEKEKELKGQIMSAMGEFDTLTFKGKTLATWKAAKAPEKFDTKTFKAAHPDLAAQFTITGEASRRFLLK